MSSRLRSTLITLVLALAVVGGERLYTSWRQGRPLWLGLSPNAPISAISKNHTNLTEYMKPPRLGSGERLLSDEKAQAEAVDAACMDFMAEAQRLNMEMFTFPPKLLPLPRAAGCTAPPAELAAVKKQYEDSCGRYIGRESTIEPANGDEWEKESMLCQVALWQLRGGITVWRNRGRALADITNMAELSDHLAFAFSHLMQEKPDGRELVQVSERILELDPHVYSAAKLATVGSLMEALNDKSLWNSEVYRDRMQWLVDRAEHINPAGSDLESLREVVVTRGLDPQFVLPWAQSQLQEDPANPRALALLGYAQWRLGQKSAAMASLRRAAELAPDDAEAQRNWQAVQQPGATPESVKLSLTVGMDLGSTLR